LKVRRVAHPARATGRLTESTHAHVVSAVERSASSHFSDVADSVALGWRIVTAPIAARA
jgi:hypothetical protein